VVNYVAVKAAQGDLLWTNFAFSAAIWDRQGDREGDE
jgi:hypothetical protein